NSGAAAVVLPRVLQEMNCTVIPLNASPAEIVVEQDEETFRGHLAEMGVIASAVKSKLGIFVDSPGERCFIVDETGEVLDHDTAFAVLSQLALAAKPGLLLGPASSSLAFSMIADQMNSRFVPTKITPGAVLRAAKHLKDRVDLTDGVKVFVDGGWVLVVPDADRPEYHIIASTLDPVRSAALVEEYSALVRSVVAEAAPESEGVVEKT